MVQIEANKTCSQRREVNRAKENTGRRPYVMVLPNRAKRIKGFTDVHIHSDATGQSCQVEQWTYTQTHITHSLNIFLYVPEEVPSGGENLDIFSSFPSSTPTLFVTKKMGLWRSLRCLIYVHVRCSCFCLYGPFNSILFHKFILITLRFLTQFFRPYFCLMVLSTIYLFTKVSFSPDIILCG